ncbi:MAG: PadR family transcriptional regulator [Candidatus Aenigmatarchaeota archaeon]
MEKVKITNIVKFYTLLLLHSGPKHGYEIIKEIEKNLNKKTSSGQIYPFLKKLQRYKYLKVKKTGTREKKIYILTKNGKIFVKKTLNRFGDLIDIAIEPKLTVCAHCGCKIYKGGYKEVIKGKKLKFCCHHCAKSYKVIKW